MLCDVMCQMDVAGGGGGEETQPKRESIAAASRDVEKGLNVWL